jgi:hypothetical protein
MQLHLISEEQHDDQLLTELLRCIKAVETAEVGLHNAIHGKVMSLTSLRQLKIGWQRDHAGIRYQPVPRARRIALQLEEARRGGYPAIHYRDRPVAPTSLLRQPGRYQTPCLYLATR